MVRIQLIELMSLLKWVQPGRRVPGNARSRARILSLLAIRNTNTSNLGSLKGDSSPSNPCFESHFRHIRSNGTYCLLVLYLSDASVKKDWIEM